MIIDIFAFVAVILLWVTKFSFKKRLLANIIILGYCVYIGLYAHSNGHIGVAVFFLIIGVFNIFATYTWLGLAYPDKRLTNGKNDPV